MRLSKRKPSIKMIRKLDVLISRLDRIRQQAQGFNREKSCGAIAAQKRENNSGRKMPMESIEF